jgi:hypothetical protein
VELHSTCHQRVVVDELRQLFHHAVEKAVEKGLEING